MFTCLHARCAHWTRSTSFHTSATKAPAASPAAAPQVCHLFAGARLRRRPAAGPEGPARPSHQTGAQRRRFEAQREGAISRRFEAQREGAISRGRGLASRDQRRNRTPRPPAPPPKSHPPRRHRRAKVRHGPATTRPAPPRPPSFGPAPPPPLSRQSPFHPVPPTSSAGLSESAPGCDPAGRRPRRPAAAPSSRQAQLGRRSSPFSRFLYVLIYFFMLRAGSHVPGRRTPHDPEPAPQGGRPPAQATGPARWARACRCYARPRPGPA